MIEQALCIGGCLLNPNLKYDPFVNYGPHQYRPAVFPNISLTHEERGVLQYSQQLYDSFNKLPDIQYSDLTEFTDAIHRIQQIVALRVARRADPDIWKTI